VSVKKNGPLLCLVKRKTRLRTTEMNEEGEEKRRRKKRRRK